MDIRDLMAPSESSESPDGPDRLAETVARARPPFRTRRCSNIRLKLGPNDAANVERTTRAARGSVNEGAQFPGRPISHSPLLHFAPRLHLPAASLSGTLSTGSYDERGKEEGGERARIATHTGSKPTDTHGKALASTRVLAAHAASSEQPTSNKGHSN